MQQPYEHAWRLQVAACFTALFLSLIDIIATGTVLSRRLRNGPREPTIYYDFAIILDTTRLVHASLVTVAVMVLFVIDQLMMVDLGKVISAVNVYSTLLWVS